MHEKACFQIDMDMEKTLVENLQKWFLYVLFCDDG